MDMGLLDGVAASRIATKAASAPLATLSNNRAFSHHRAMPLSRSSSSSSFSVCSGASAYVNSCLEYGLDFQPSTPFAPYHEDTIADYGEQYYEEQYRHSPPAAVGVTSPRPRSQSVLDLRAKGERRKGFFFTSERDAAEDRDVTQGHPGGEEVGATGLLTPPKSSNGFQHQSGHHHENLAIIDPYLNREAPPPASDLGRLTWLGRKGKQLSVPPEPDQNHHKARGNESLPQSKSASNIYGIFQDHTKPTTDHNPTHFKTRLLLLTKPKRKPSSESEDHTESSSLALYKAKQPAISMDPSKNSTRLASPLARSPVSIHGSRSVIELAPPGSPNDHRYHYTKPGRQAQSIDEDDPSSKKIPVKPSESADADDRRSITTIASKKNKGRKKHSNRMAFVEKALLSMGGGSVPHVVPDVPGRRLGVRGTPI